VDSEADAALTAYARLFSRAMRTTYAEQERAVREGREQSKAIRKAQLVEAFHLTSRQANAVLMEADARRKSILELYDTQLEDLQTRLRKVRKQLKTVRATLAKHKAGKTIRLTQARAASSREKAFRYQTRIQKLEARIAELKRLKHEGITHLTFGMKDRLRMRAELKTRKQIRN
jgi:hypothetical protein